MMTYAETIGGYSHVTNDDVISDDIHSATSHDFETDLWSGVADDEKTINRVHSNRLYNRCKKLQKCTFCYRIIYFA